MNNITAPSLASLKNLYFDLAFDTFVEGLIPGYLWGKWSQANPNLTMAIFTTRAIAQTIFYHLVNHVFGKKNVQPQKHYLFTSTVVNMTFLVILRELNLSGRLSSCLLGLGIAGHLIYRVRYIQEQERKLILKEETE